MNVLLHTFTATYQVSVLLRLSALWNYHTYSFSYPLSQMFLLFQIRTLSLHSQTRIRIDTSRRQSYISNIHKYSVLISFVLLPNSYQTTLIVCGIVLLLILIILFTPMSTISWYDHCFRSFHSTYWCCESSVFWVSAG